MPDELFNLYSLWITGLGFTLTIAGLLLLLVQISAGRRGTETDLLVRLYEISTSALLTEDFDTIWDLPKGRALTDQETEACLRSCLFFEMVGSITSQKYVNTILIEEYFGSLITGSYSSLKEYIQQTRSRPHNDKFAINFERLAKEIEKSKRISKPLEGPTFSEAPIESAILEAADPSLSKVPTEAGPRLAD